MPRLVGPASLAMALVIAACATTPPAPSFTYAPPTPSRAPSLPPSKSPPPEPSIEPTPDSSQAWQQFISPRFGWSVSLPAGWFHTPATEDWPPNVYPTATSNFTDRFDVRPASFPAIDIQTQQLPAGTTQEAFLAWLDAENAKICTIESTEEVVVDDEPARFQRQTCGYNAWEVVAFDGDRVYLMYWLGATTRVEQERPILESILETFEFAPTAG